MAIEDGLWLETIIQFACRANAGWTRALLRPQRAMRFKRETFGTKGSSWWSECEYGRTYLTRAQAARAAFLG